MPKVPLSVRSLRTKIQNIHPRNPIRVERIIANIIICQMLPSSGVRGGTGLKIKLGDRVTRASKDLDLVLSETQEDFLQKFRDSLALGWNGFNGVIVASKRISKPAGVPFDYIIQSVDIKLSYLRSDWLRQELDLGHDEIGDTADFDLETSEEISKWFELCGLPLPSPIPVIKPHHQIVQKIHALTATPEERIHDLVDIQVIINSMKLDQELVKSTCVNLFKFRKAHDWPPTLEYNEESTELYVNAVEETGAIDNLEEAVEWFNNLIKSLQSNS